MVRPGQPETRPEILGKFGCGHQRDVALSTNPSTFLQFLQKRLPLGEASEPLTSGLRHLPPDAATVCAVCSLRPKARSSTVPGCGFSQNLEVNEKNNEIKGGGHIYFSSTGDIFIITIREKVGRGKGPG